MKDNSPQKNYQDNNLKEKGITTYQKPFGNDLPYKRGD